MSDKEPVQVLLFAEAIEVNYLLIGKPVASWIEATAQSNTRVIVCMIVNHKYFGSRQITNLVAHCICVHLYRVSLVSSYCNLNNNHVLHVN